MSASAPNRSGSHLEIYLWYEAREEQEAQVRSAFADLCNAMGQAGFVDVSAHARLLKRTGVALRDGETRHTWMEIWTGVAREDLAAWCTGLEQCAQTCGLAPLAQSGRHLEIFESV